MTYADQLAAELGADEQQARSGPAPRRNFGDSVYAVANSIPTTSILDRLGVSHDGEKFAECPGCGEPKALLCEGGGTKCLHNRCSAAGPPGKPGFYTNVDLVATRENIPALEAAKRLCGWFGIEVPGSGAKDGENNCSQEDDWQPSDDDAPDAPPMGMSPIGNNGEAPKRQAWPKHDVAAIFAPLEPVAFAVRALDLCPGAPAMLAGYGYSGKTIAAQAAALAVASGQRVWGSFEATQGRVLHVDYEQGPRLTRERYQRLAAGMMVGPSDLGDRLALVSMPKVYLDVASPDILAGLLDGYQFAIIDSLRAACPTLAENDSTIRVVLDNLTRASEQTGCTVIVIHHARKPSRDTAGGAKMAIRGSGALFDACGSVLVFEAEKGQPTRVSHEKARVTGKLADDFLLTITDTEVDGDARGGLVVSAEGAPSREDVADHQAKAGRKARTQRVVLELEELFREEPEQPGAAAIAAKLHRSAPDVRQALALLVADKHVEALGSTRDRRHRWVA